MAKELVHYLTALHEIIVHVSGTIKSDKQATLLANAQAMMNVFAQIVVSWIWIRQASVAEQKLMAGDATEKEANFYKGKIQAAQYFISWELPTIDRDLKILKQDNDVCSDMDPDWF
jgi:butyryl-CoA dehydrogenase